jgi:uncharacterized protein (TIGR03435 family)
MLALFAFGQALPRLPLRILDTPAASAGIFERTTPPTIFEETADAPPLAIPTPASPRRPIDWSAVAAYAYGVIVFALLARFVIGMFLMRKLRATADPISCVGADRLYESNRITVPVTIGWLRPRILLPPDWRDWSQDKLDAVLAHEGAHSRRHDGLIAALAHVNRCIFWFHPLAWILERRLAMLAEQACDESSVATLGDRNRYANILLEMASVVDTSHGRMRYHARTMASGSHIRRRIDLVLQEGRTFSRGLTWAGWTALLLCGIPVVLCAGAVDLAQLPPLPRIEIPRSSAPLPPLSEPSEQRQPKLVAQARPTPSTPSPATQPAPEVAPVSQTPHFTAVSIKPVDISTPLRSLGGPNSPNPGSLSFVGNLLTLMAGAYQVSLDCVSGPSFIQSQRYEVTAQFPPDTTLEQFRQMEANLLTEHFGLVLHRSTKDVTAYQLIVAPGGLTPAISSAEADPAASRAPGDSAPPVTGVDGFPILPPGMTFASNVANAMVRMTFRRASMNLLASRLRSILSGSGDIIPVANQTGLNGWFDFRVEVPEPLTIPKTIPNISMPANVPPNLRALFQPSGDPNVHPADISAAIEKQLGLRLDPEATKLDFIVIDQVNRMPTDH